jgi:hypothetical protein
MMFSTVLMQCRSDLLKVGQVTLKGKRFRADGLEKEAGWFPRMLWL